ncbi:MAG: carbamoyltransferase [Gammaproteobacteria bacterium]|nr:MAG: carbamoyltransferase [Gammaproteobacteria bacterium]
MTTPILGISAYYHDSAAALIVDGDIVAAAQEERFSRKKHDAGFPADAIAYCLREADLQLADVAHIVFYDKPFIKFERLIETYLAFAPRGFKSFFAAIPVWLKEKLYLKKTLRRELSALGGIPEKELPALMFTEHHQSHAASAFFPSPFQKSAVICFDGVGEWATTSVWLGEDNRLVPQWEVNFPHSLGLLYSAFTYYTGFRVNSGEYKLMGLAPYGEPRYSDLILQNLIDVKQDGTFRLDMSYFDYATGLTMTTDKFHRLFDGPPRTPEADLSQKEMDIARSIQVVTEEIVLKLARTVHRELGADHLCLAGGVALNCVANGRLLREGPFASIWIQPAAGDAGGALGAALAIWYEYLENPRVAEADDSMQGAFLGPAYSNTQIRESLDDSGGIHEYLEEDALVARVARLIAEGRVIGWLQGRMEFGPRALGNRSIIGDPRSSRMQSVMNLKIKFRESFRPFAPAIKADKVHEWFEQEVSSPYMLFVAPVAADKLTGPEDGEPVAGDQAAGGLQRLHIIRSSIPAVTHVDCSARVQTVHHHTNPRFYHLLDEFEQLTGCPLLVNTSFNVRGEPIVNTPEEAYRCFMRTEMDYLVMGNYLLAKPDQPGFDDDGAWQQEFELD